MTTKSKSAVELQPVDDGAQLPTITMPSDESAEEIVANAKLALEKAGIPVTHFNENFVEIVRQHLELVRGQKLQVLNHNFGHDWEISECRSLQMPQGFDGNAAAHFVCVSEILVGGYSVSIPNDDSRFFHGSDGLFCASLFPQTFCHCLFTFFDVRVRLHGNISAVSFRAI